MELIDVCEFIVDCPHSTAQDEGEGYPLIRTPNIGKGRLILDGVHRVSEEIYQSRNARGIPQDNDIIFAREATPGNVAIIKNGLKVCLGQRTVLIRPNSTLVDPDYLTYYLLAPKQQNALLSSANGSTVAHVNMPKIRKLQIDIPSISIQQRIASILSAYDDLIENNQKQIKLLEEAAQRLYKEWFVDLRFPGHEQVKIVDGVPEGWSKKKIIDCVDLIKRGISPKYNDVDGKFTVISQKCVRTNIVDFSLARKEDKEFSDMLALHNMDTVICSTGIGTLGRVGQVYGNYPLATCDSHVTLLRAKKSIGANYLFWSLKRNQNYLMSMGIGSTQQQELYRSVIEQVEIIVPDGNIMNNFEQIVVSIHSKIKFVSEQIKLLKEARDRLLPKLMSGEIEL